MQIDLRFASTKLQTLVVLSVFHHISMERQSYGVAISTEVKQFLKGTEYVEGENIGATFRVEDLLDFSNEQLAGITIEDNGGDCLQLFNQSAGYYGTASEKVSADLTRNSTQPSKTINEDEITIDLCVRCEDIAELEWLSAFVEESFNGAADFKVVGSRCTNSQSCTDKNAKTHDSSSGSESISNLNQDISVPGKARSKRSRAGERVWSSGMITSATCSGYQSGTASFLSFDGPVISAETEFIATTELLCGSGPFHFKKLAKFCKRKVWQGDASQPRRCAHCLTQRTPQWRAGPMGPKTLCNACGVRYKSGRLLPEYRPAGSPTFISHKHSNSHRKVLDMRRQKEA